MSDIGEMIFLPPVLEASIRKLPTPNWRCSPVSRRLSRRLATGELVAAVGNLPHLDNSGNLRPFFEETYVCLARKQNKLFTMADNRAIFDEARHVHVASKASGHVLVEEALQSRGYGERSR
jgi:DNA-binding transcriptional LysR family regulator